MFCIGLVLCLLEQPLLSNTHSSKIKSAQYFPIEAQWCLPNRECILLEIADTDLEKKVGLMHRKFLANSSGMLFKFFPSRIVRFWMYDTIISLDMIFLNKGTIVALETNAQPCSLSPCPTFGPDVLVDSVIEIAAGEVERLNIKVGDHVKINQVFNPLE